MYHCMAIPGQKRRVTNIGPNCSCISSACSVELFSSLLWAPNGLSQTAEDVFLLWETLLFAQWWKYEESIVDLIQFSSLVYFQNWLCKVKTHTTMLCIVSDASKLCKKNPEKLRRGPCGSRGPIGAAGAARGDPPLTKKVRQFHCKFVRFPDTWEEFLNNLTNLTWFGLIQVGSRR